MRYFALFLMVVSLCVFAVGCPPADTPSSTPPTEITPPEPEGDETADETAPEGEPAPEEKAPEEGSTE